MHSKISRQQKFYLKTIKNRLLMCRVLELFKRLDFITRKKSIKLNAFYSIVRKKISKVFFILIFYKLVFK